MAILGAGLIPASASASISSVLSGETVSGQAIPCTTQPDGTRVCQGDFSSSGGPDTRLKSFDGTPLAVYVILPPAPASGTDGSYPLVVQSHGWGGQAGGAADTQYGGPTADQWAKDGYAVLQLTARGFGDSCGSAASRLADPAGCANGYIRLDDDRYEVRDVQNAIGLLVDDDIADPAEIGVTGESYGGGVSLALATLRNRVMNADGSVSPWRSPAGTSLRIAAAAPVIPWSDLVYALIPNGRTLDYQVASPTADLTPLGVEKQSFVSGLYALGSLSGYYAPAGSDAQADLTTWFASLNAGEPYDGNAEDEAIATQIAQYHSSYYLLDGAYGVAPEAPPPLLIANGFTDDLFPVDQALRYYNLERAKYPGDWISLFDFDGGHERGQNKPADGAILAQRIQEFFDTFVRTSPKPLPRTAPSVTALTQACPKAAPSGGPFTASTWAGLHPGEVDFTSEAAQTVSSAAGNPTVAQAVDPISGPGACATATATDQGAGVASYRLPAATGSGYTLLGSPTVIANLSPNGTFPELAARLWDVDPAANTETLVARGLYRVTAGGPQVFQLHPGAWHFAAGHIPKLELLGQDSPYARTSNGQFSIAVSDLELRLPVHEVPGTPGTPGAVAPPRPPFSSPAARCTARPTSRIAKRAVRASRHGFFVRGNASERQCPGAAVAVRRKERVAHVFVSVYRTYAHGRCRFLLRSGRLGAKRSCAKPVQFRARGTGVWSLRRRQRIPRGTYLLRADAVDGLHRHQRHSGASVVRVRVR
ncbi:MAG: CocE/NonD family hydrolase [Solirubrobacteraceae bacterium]